MTPNGLLKNSRNPSRLATRTPREVVPSSPLFEGWEEQKSDGAGSSPFTFYEFFAGGGMASAGLGARWACQFANDFDQMKGHVYAANWGSAHLRVGDVEKLKPTQLPGQVDLAWASFPCQDLSLAGVGAGLSGSRSGTFWAFWKLMQALNRELRAPRMIVLENVCGTLTSNGGRDFRAISEALATEGYNFGPLVVDAALFLPQSRPRLFVVAVHSSLLLPAGTTSPTALSEWHPPTLRSAVEKLPSHVRERLVWWNLPLPPSRAQSLADVLEDSPTGVTWNSTAQTERILAMMSDRNTEKVADAKRRSLLSGAAVAGTIYKRTRPEADGKKHQRAEVRFDGTAGCLRTPSGGSSRQTIIVVDKEVVRTRLLSPREAARLMGLPDAYRLPVRYNDAYHLAGDGVAVPVVRHLASALAEPVLLTNRTNR